MRRALRRAVVAVQCGARAWRQWLQAGVGRERKANDVDEPARALNGFLVLRLRGDQIVEEFRDESGNLRWQR